MPEPDSFSADAASRFRSIALVTLCLALVLAPSRVAAGTGLVAVAGNGKTPDLKLFSLVAESVAKEAGWTLAAGALDLKSVREASACIDRERPLPCLAAFLSPRGADRLLLLQVGASADDPAVLQITATIVFGGGGEPSVAERFCRACDETAVRTVVSDLVKSLIRAAEMTTGRTLVSVTATPPGAWIYLDGEMVPATTDTHAARAQIPTYPGRHTVMVESARHQSKVLEVTALEGQTFEVKVDLQELEQARATPTPPRPRESSADWRTPVGWGLLGTGIGLAVAGGILYGLDEDRAIGPDEVHSETTFNSAALGVKTGLAGVGLASVGAILLFTRPARTSRFAPSPASGPALTVMPGGGAVTWSKVF
jgi:hypothetical protein